MKQAVTLWIFALTLFLSAAIMFAVQPMTGKMLLPLVGGTPAGWIVALAFFQIMLLLGYFLAHMLSRFSPYLHGLFYILCLAAGAAFLPVGVSASAAHANGAVGIFLLLAVAVGPPFVALSATSSTVQRLFTVTGHASADDPYFLYMASNLGSFTGLLLYPLLAEPRLTLGAQSQAVSFGYIALMLMAGLCLANARLTGMKARKKAVEEKKPETARPTGLLRLQWLGLSFVPSSLLLGTTTYITTDVLSAPMIWVLPLALYLLTFIIAFSRKPLFPPTAIAWLQPYVICAAVFVMSLMQASWLGGWAGVAFYLAIFGIVALGCHMRLASLRPAAESHLTEFYLMMSIGGALGGVLNAFIIPYAFSRLAELPLMLMASFLLHPAFDYSTRRGKAFAGGLALAVVLVNLGQTNLLPPEARNYISSFCLLAFIAAPIAIRPLLQPANLVFGALAVFMISQLLISDERLVLNLRNFYGTLRVNDTAETADGKTYTLRRIRHGSTIHGAQVLDKKLEREPTAYYAKNGPLSDIFAAYRPAKIAGVGLGAGAINCYTAPGRHFTFFELDPDVVKIAERHFTFLSKCQPNPGMYVGDGRLELAKLKKEKFNLIVLDAFTSDAIPTHLLTKEAFELYFQRLEAGGVLAIHISNRYFELWDAVASTAETLGYTARMRLGGDAKTVFYGTLSRWIVVGKQQLVDRLDNKQWPAVKPDPATLPWTDNYSNLLDTMTILNSRPK